MSEENGNENQSSETISSDDYRKVVESYSNLRSEYDRRDKEINELRTKVKQYEGTSEKQKENIDEEEDRPLTKSEVERLLKDKEESLKDELIKNMKVEETVKKLQTDMEVAKNKYPFVDEKLVLDELSKKQGISVEDAILLLYRDKLYKQPEIIETDKGGRTIDSTPITNTEGRSVKQGFAGNMSDFISKRFDKRFNEDAGIK